MTATNYGTAGRIDRIRMDLIELAKLDIIAKDWYMDAPGDRGRRWHLGGQTYSTREVECFIRGAHMARFGRYRAYATH